MKLVLKIYDFKEKRKHVLTRNDAIRVYIIAELRQCEIAYSRKPVFPQNHKSSFKLCRKYETKILRNKGIMSKCF